MRKSGFTLVEVLVVMAIIAIVTSVSLPAVQQARLASRRNQCSNNLKQLGLALHNYHDTFSVFPPGWVAKDYSADTRPMIGWQVSILPMVEQIGIFKEYEFGVPMPRADGNLQLSIPTYRCPTDVTAATNPFRDNYGTSNYALNYGDTRPPHIGVGRESVNWPGAAEVDRRTNGIGSCNSRVRIRDFIDGTSNTFAAGEKTTTSRAGIWPGPVRNRYDDDVAADGSHQSRLNKSATGFSSNHRGGANFLFCDGSVHFINDEIDSRPPSADRGEPVGTYQKLANREDGQVIGEF